MPGFKTTFILLFNLIKTNMRNVTSREGGEKNEEIAKKCGESDIRESRGDEEVKWQRPYLNIRMNSCFSPWRLLSNPKKTYVSRVYPRINNPLPVCGQEGKKTNGSRRGRVQKSAVISRPFSTVPSFSQKMLQVGNSTLYSLRNIIFLYVSREEDGHESLASYLTSSLEALTGRSCPQ